MTRNEQEIDVNRRRKALIVCALGLALCIFGGSASAEGPLTTVAGAVKTAPPVAKPLGLEPAPAELNPEVAGSATANAPATALAPVDDVISACEIVELRGAEITFRVHYRINAGRSQPIWAGAWLYDASGRSIDAGYKPVAIPGLPEGSIDVMVTRPDEGAAAELVETFLMESGKPAFVIGRFRMPGVSGGGAVAGAAEPQGAGGGDPAAEQPTSNEEFCETYAKLAVAQYAEAVAQHLPDIVPPVWSNDAAGHYSWCLGEPRELVERGSALRQSHLEQNIGND